MHVKQQLLKVLQHAEDTIACVIVLYNIFDSTCIERFCVHSGHTKQATMMYPSLIGHSSLMKGCVCIWRSYTWRSAKLLKLVQYTNLSVVTLCVKYFSPTKAIACLEDLQTLTQDLCVCFYWKASSVYARIHASKTSTNLFCICFHTSRRPSSSIQRLPVRADFAFQLQQIASQYAHVDLPMHAACSE